MLTKAESYCRFRIISVGTDSTDSKIKTIKEMKEIKVDILKWYEFLHQRDKRRYQQFMQRHRDLMSHLLMEAFPGMIVNSEKALAEIFFLAMARKISPDKIASPLEKRIKRIIRYSLQNKACS